MGDPTYLDHSMAVFGDIEITILTNENSEEYRRDDLLFMYKSIGYIESYKRIRSEIGGSAPNILEIGVARGGGTAFMHQFFDAERVVAIDINQAPPVPLENYRVIFPGVIRPYYGTSQSDTQRLTEIIESEFPKGIDLIIDDASHAYAPSKISFEAAFPYLRSGGIYVLEDWNWSHTDGAQQQDHFYSEQLALTNLVFDLTAIHGTDSGIIDYIGMASAMMWIRRGWKPISKGSFRIDEAVLTRGKIIDRI